MPKLEAVTAIVIAGGPAPAEVVTATGVGLRALIPVCDHPLIEYTLDALRDSRHIGTIHVVAPPEVEPVAQEYGAGWTQSQDTMLANLWSGLERFRDTPWMLLCGCDCPLLTPEIVDALLTQCAAVEADVYYPIIPMDIVEAQYPGGERTTLKLKEGVFTGGNLFLVRPAAMLRQKALIDRLIEYRKDKLKLLQLFGLPFVVQFFTRQLRIAGLESRATQLLGVQVRAISTPYPEIGIDLDKAVDHELLSAALAKQRAARLGFFSRH